MLQWEAHSYIITPNTTENLINSTHTGKSKQIPLWFTYYSKTLYLFVVSGPSLSILLYYIILLSEILPL